MTDNLTPDLWTAIEVSWLKSGQLPGDGPFVPYLAALSALENGTAPELQNTASELSEHSHHELAAVLLRVLRSHGTHDRQLLAEPPSAAGSSAKPAHPAVAAFQHHDTDRSPLQQDAEAHTDASTPLLDAVREILRNPPETLQRNPAVGSKWPRAEQLLVAGTALSIHGTVTQATIEQAFDEVRVDFNPVRWPDLKVDRHFLHRWLGSPQEWKTAHKLALKKIQQESETVQSSMLAAILRRIHQNLDEQNVRVNRHLARAAAELAVGVERPDAGRSSIEVTLAMLADRLRWIEDEHPTPPMLVALWGDQSLTDPERMRVARDLLELERPLPREIAIAAQFFLLANIEDPAEAAALLASGAAAAPRDMVLSGLQEMNTAPVRVVHLMAVHAILNGELGPGLAGIRTLIEDYQGSDIAQTLFLRIFQALPRDQDLPPALLSELADLLDGLRPADWDPQTLIPLALTTLDFLPQLPAGFLKRILNEFDAAETPQQLAAKIFCGYLEDDKRSKHAVRDAGRRLRKLPPSHAHDLALQLLAWTAVWGDETLRHELAPSLRPLSRYLLRLESSLLAAAAQRCAQVGAAELRGALMWYFWHRDEIEDDPLWVDLCFKAVRVPESLEHLGARIVRWALEQEPETFAEFRGRVGQRVETLLAGSATGRKAMQADADQPIRTLPVLPPDASSCRRVFVDRHGEMVPDPFIQLGLTPQAILDEDVVRTSWVGRLQEFRPEEDPERARRLREARERLLSSDHLYERKFGLLWVPEPDEPEAEAPGEQDPAENFLPAWERIAGQLVVYCLVEELVEGG